MRQQSSKAPPDGYDFRERPDTSRRGVQSHRRGFSPGHNSSPHLKTLLFLVEGAEQQCQGYLLVLAVWKHKLGETRSLGFSPGRYFFSHLKGQFFQGTAWVLVRAKAQTTALPVASADALDMALLATQFFPTERFLPD